ncbi:MAG: glycosyltransferase family 1 protein, partial [Solimonas sp.]
RIVFTGRISDEYLASLYRGAVCLVFPSFYEGFGLPIVEAFACGTPVITSNTTSMPEISAGAAMLVDPSNMRELTEAMDRVCDDVSLRERLIKLGLERVGNYNWESVARRVRDAISSVDTDSSAPLHW